MTDKGRTDTRLVLTRLVLHGKANGHTTVVYLHIQGVAGCPMHCFLGGPAHFPECRLPYLSTLFSSSNFISSLAFLPRFASFLFLALFPCLTGRVGAEAVPYVLRSVPRLFGTPC